jgi:methyl-accepting chemotaxis protein
VKLIGGFIMTVLIALAIGVQDRFGLITLENQMNQLAGVEMTTVQDVTDIESLQQQVRSNLNLLLAQTLSSEERVDVHDRLTDLQGRMRERLETLKAREGLSATVLNEIGNMEEAMTPWIESTGKIITLSNQLVTMDVTEPDALSSKLISMASWYYELMDKVSRQMLFGTPFPGGEDIEESPLGQWLQTFTSKNKEINYRLDRLGPILKTLHASISEIKAQAASGDMDGARETYKRKAMLTASNLYGVFFELMNISSQAQYKFRSMIDLAKTEESAAREGVQQSLDQLVSLVNMSATSHVASARRIAATVKERSVIILGAGALVSLLIGIFLTRSITAPLSKGVELARAMAAGDLSRTMDVRQKDEIGILADALNEMVANLRAMLGDVSSQVTAVTASSAALAGISEQVADGATLSVEKAEQVTTAAGDMSDNQNSVAAAMEQAAVNISTVAAATEEMSSTIDEISANAGKAKTITDQAVRQADQASSRVNDLGTAANDISKVTETITAISSQTNLLALNATIEAARAGEAGRGFAVVANEIKELAQQTAAATEEIRARILGIQDATNVTVTEIGSISGIIADVDAIVATIAVAVEEQSATTRDIAANVGQASEGIAEVNSNVAHGSAVSREIATDISEVSVQAREILASSEQVRQSAAGLSDTAMNLKDLVSRFTLEA